MGPAEMVQIADMMDRVIKNYDNAAIKAQVRQEVKELCARYPIYTDLQI